MLAAPFVVLDVLGFDVLGFDVLGFVEAFGVVLAVPLDVLGFVEAFGFVLAARAFVEAFDRRRHQGETQFSVGATHSITRRLTDKGGDWWVTLFGEVPIATLQVLAQGLERTR